MTARIKFSLNLYWPLFIALAVSICAIEIWIVSSAFFMQNPNVLAFGMTTDIVIIIPMLYYCFIVRKKQAPMLTLIPVIVLDQNVLFIRTGLRWHATLPLANIAAIKKFNAREKRSKEYLRLSVFGDPRLVISCRQPVLVQGLFGIKREVSQLGLTVDDEKLFVDSLRQRLSIENC